MSFHIFVHYVATQMDLIGAWSSWCALENNQILGFYNTGSTLQFIVNFPGYASWRGYNGAFNKGLNFVKIKGNKKMKEYLKPFLFETVAHLIKLRNLVKVNNF